MPGSKIGFLINLLAYLSPTRPLLEPCFSPLHLRLPLAEVLTIFNYITKWKRVKNRNLEASFPFKLLVIRLKPFLLSLLRKKLLSVLLWDDFFLLLYLCLHILHHIEDLIISFTVLFQEFPVMNGPWEHLRYIRLMWELRLPLWAYLMPSVCIDKELPFQTLYLK